MPFTPLSPEEESELRTYLAGEGSNDTEASALLAQHVAATRSTPNASVPSMGKRGSPAPAAQNTPNDKRRQNRSPAEADYPLVGGGAGIGGAIGSTVGTPLGLLGRTVGGAVGGFVGNLSQQNINKNPKQGVQFDMSGSEPVPVQPDNPDTPDKPLDYGQALKAGAVQGGLTLGLGMLGKGAVKLGFPKIGAFLGAGTPRQAVVNAAPQAASGVSTPALQMVDAAAQKTPQAAVQAASQGAATSAAQAPISAAGANAAQQIPGVQAQMAQNVGPLAQKTAGFADALKAAAPQAADPTQLSGNALRDVLNTGNLGGTSPQDLLQAFRRPTSFPWAAGNPDVMAARAQMSTLGSQQGQLADVLAKLKGQVTAAQGMQSAPQLAADAQGLSSISKLGVPTPSLGGGKLKALLSALGGGQGGDVAKVNLRGGPRAAQTVSALLGDQATQPISDSAAYPGLGDLLKMLAQNRSNY